MTTSITAPDYVNNARLIRLKSQLDERQLELIYATNGLQLWSNYMARLSWVKFHKLSGLYPGRFLKSCLAKVDYNVCTQKDSQLAQLIRLKTQLDGKTTVTNLCN